MAGSVLISLFQPEPVQAILFAEHTKSWVWRLFVSAAVIVAILLIGIFFDSWLKRLLSKVRLDPRQAGTLHAVISTGLQIIALGLVLLVIFGPPSQLGTILGLAGAGPTVALKDFIVSFIGWFVLMGRNGIRLGDWVEINGVTGLLGSKARANTPRLRTHRPGRAKLGQPHPVRQP